MINKYQECQKPRLRAHTSCPTVKRVSAGHIFPRINNNDRMEYGKGTTMRYCQIRPDYSGVGTKGPSSHPGGVYPGMYGRVYLSGGVYPGMYHGRTSQVVYTRVCTMVGYLSGGVPWWYMPGMGGIHPGICHLCTPGIHHSVYTPLYHPGYTTTMHVYHDQGVRCAPVPAKRALGSALRLITDMRRIEPFLLSKV